MTENERNTRGNAVQQRGVQQRDSRRRGTQQQEQARQQDAPHRPAPHRRAVSSGQTASSARSASSSRAASRTRSSRERQSSAKRAVMGLNARFVALLAAIIVVIVLIAAVRGCAGTAADASSGALSAGADAAASSSEMAVQESQIDLEEYRDQVFSWLEDDYAEQLMKAAATDEDAAWIVSHIDAYAVDGSSVQYKLLKLAAVEPQARTFVRNWPSSYPSSQAQACDASWSGRIPHLYQWDERWGYTLYCNTTFALTGCCPTSLAMVYQGLTGNADLSPYDLGVMAEERGYMDAFNGTSTAFLTDCAPGLGLNCRQVSVSADALMAALSAGEVLVCNVGPGDFTTGGHFIVLAGLDANGDVVVNDPFSAQRSAVSWSADTIISQTKALWAYSLA